MRKYEQILEGTWAPFRLCSRRCPIPLLGRTFGTLAANDFNFLTSVDVVITTDKQNGQDVLLLKCNRNGFV